MMSTISNVHQIRFEKKKKFCKKAAQWNPNSMCANSNCAELILRNSLHASKKVPNVILIEQKIGSIKNTFEYLQERFLCNLTIKPSKKCSNPLLILFLLLWLLLTRKQINFFKKFRWKAAE